MTPEPVAWMVEWPGADANWQLWRNDERGAREVERLVALATPGMTITPLYAGPCREEWGYKTDWGFCVTASRGMAERMAATGPSSVVRRLVSDWEEVK